MRLYDLNDFTGCFLRKRFWLDRLVHDGMWQDNLKSRFLPPPFFLGFYQDRRFTLACKHDESV